MGVWTDQSFVMPAIISAMNRAEGLALELGRRAISCQKRGISIKIVIENGMRLSRYSSS